VWFAGADGGINDYVRGGHGVSGRLGAKSSFKVP
jgi:hypothetical protein